ncbi:MAG: nitrile hydratase subunit alpha [Defluviicoccus sp.]|nr:nitrile hydratase subunit alpha [Defluviicoccus sp.]
MAEDERGHAEVHHHDHEVAPENRDVEETGHYELMATAIRDLLVEKGVVTPEQIRTQLEFMDSRGPAVGAQIIARAWTDPAFRERLLDDGTAAVAELGVPMAGTQLVVVENTPDAHNMIVCTLCSCYPRTILGLPPDWYKSKSYRSRAVIEPRAVLREFGTEIPDGVTVRVHDSNADMRYLVLPMRPEGTAGWDAERLAGIVTRDCMVGTALPQA